MNKQHRMAGMCCLAVFAALLFLGCATIPAERRIDNIPMYGQPEIPRPEALKEADADFIEKAIAGFNGSRELASKAWAEVANDFFQKGNLDYAMRRYNQAWLLNEKNYQPYWGFGQVMMVRERFDEAIKFYERAQSLIDDKCQEPALLTDLGLAYSFKARSIFNDQDTRNKYFGIANNHFEASSNLDNTYAVVWEAWANSLYHEKKYAEAWEKVRKATEMGRPVHPMFRERLNQAMPEPN